MTANDLAGLSNLSLYTSMVLLTLAGVLYAVDLAQRAAMAPAVVGEPAVDPRTAPRAAGRWAGTAMWLAAALSVATVVLRAAAVGRPPLGNMYEFSITMAAFTLVAFCLWSLRVDLRWLGAGVSLMALLLLGMALAVFTAPGDLMPSLQDVWLGIHVSVATLAAALFTLGFALVVLHLVVRGTERPTTGWRSVIPDSATLERLSYAVHVVAFPLWTFTVVAGAIWAQKAWGTYWQWDPKEVWSFVIWVLYAAYLHARATAGWARYAPYLAVAGYVAIILNFLVVNYFFKGMHSYA